MTTRFDDLPPALREAILARIGGQAPIQGTMGDTRIRCVGSRVYPRPVEETFVEFLWHVLWRELGEDWFGDQSGQEEKHQIALWYAALEDWQEENRTSENQVMGGWSALPSGNVQSLTSLAYDVYQLAHAMCLPTRLLDRLKDRHEFQGARYEIAIAAMFLRSEFELDFLDDDETRHCEFIAKHVFSDHAVGVEAKSRRKRGVLHERGEADEKEIVHSDVRQLFEKALTQKPEGLPYIIFIDVNSPPAIDKDPLATPWGEDLKACFETHDAIYSGKADPSDPFNAVVVTNFSAHYYAAAEARYLGERFMIKSVRPKDSLPDDVLNWIWQGVSRYGVFPENLDNEG